MIWSTPARTLLMFSPILTVKIWWCIKYDAAHSFPGRFHWKRFIVFQTLFENLVPGDEYSPLRAYWCLRTCVIVRWWCENMCHCPISPAKSGATPFHGVSRFKISEKIYLFLILPSRVIVSNWINNIVMTSQCMFIFTCVYVPNFTCSIVASGKASKT